MWSTWKDQSRRILTKEQLTYIEVARRDLENSQNVHTFGILTQCVLSVCNILGFHMYRLKKMNFSNKRVS
jgi:hypothetical protein